MKSWFDKEMGLLWAMKVIVFLKYTTIAFVFLVIAFGIFLAYHFFSF